MPEQYLIKGKVAAIAVAAWNEKHPVGTKVDVRRDLGSPLRTKTSSAAWVLAGHTAVILVEGVSGCFLLERVRVVA